MKYIPYRLLVLLLVILPFAACDSAAAKEPAPDNSVLVDEGFSWKNSSILRVYGSKDKDMALRITTLFMSTSPDCKGMYVLEEPNPSENSMSKPGSGPAGVYYHTQTAFQRNEEYEISVPLQLSHPQCEWYLANSIFYLKNDFTSGNDRIPRGGQTVLEMYYKSIKDLDKYPEIKRSALYLENFMSEMKMHCYKHISEAGRHFIQSYFEGQKGTNSRTMMTVESTATSADMRLNLHIEGIIDSTKGEELPNIPEFATGDRRK